jgi:hypothetical protein
MKKGIAVITLLITFALQTASHESNGLKIVEWSPQLLSEY